MKRSKLFLVVTAVVFGVVGIVGIGSCVKAGINDIAFSLTCLGIALVAALLPTRWRGLQNAGHEMNNEILVAFLTVSAFFFGMWVDSHFQGDRYSLSADGTRLDKRTGEVVIADTAERPTVVIPAP
jgi:O-antigen/teichoic acid export membrane protein